MEHRFTVSGMTCGHCEKAVTQALRAVDPAAHIAIERTENLVKVTSEQPAQVLAQAITAEGYTVSN